MTIGKRISELRKERGLSQEYIAEQLGVSRQAVSKWEGDATAPDTSNLIALAELFAVSVEYLATGRLPEFPPVPPEPGKELRVQKILGLILIAAGLVSVILGILFPQTLAALGLLAFYLLLGGTVCLTVRQHAGRIIVLAFAVSTLVPLLLFSIFRAKPNAAQVTVQTVEDTVVLPE